MGSIQTSDGVTINYDRSGSGPTLILVHGITEDRHTWGSIASDLSSDHDVINLDLRGHGQSSKGSSYDTTRMGSDLAELTEQLGINRPHLIGHSLGGIVVTAAAAICDVASVINIDQMLRLDAFQDLLLGAEEMLRSEAFPMVMHAMFAEMAGPTTPSSVTEATKGYASAADQEVVLGVWEPVLTQSTADLVALVDAITGAITVPYLAIHGTDPGDGYSSWLTGAVKTSSLEIWEGGGHWPHRAEQDRFTARAREFHDQI